MYCPKCGTKNPNNAMFCKNCGHKMVEEKETTARVNQNTTNQYRESERVTVESGSTNTNTNNKKSGGGITSYIICCCACILILAFIGSLMNY